MDKYNYCHIAERTDVGCKRPQNEDWLTHFDCENGRIAVVCDGMGGHVGGREASHTAIDAIQQFCTQNRYDDPRQLIVAAIDYANKQILAKTSSRPELNGMGSTCVMLVVRDGLVYIGSVGDSRIYIMRDMTLRQLTKDQSYVQMLVDSGALRPEEAEHHPRKNEILNALGIADMKPATVLPDAIIPQAGDCYLLCSDGLSGMVSDQKILQIVSQQSSMSSQERVDRLVEEARNNGGLDNITAQIVEFSVSPSSSAKGSDKRDNEGGTGKTKKSKLWIWIVAAVVVIAAIVAAVLLYKRQQEPQPEAFKRETVTMGPYEIVTTDHISFLTDKGECVYTVNNMKQSVFLGKEICMDSVRIKPETYTRESSTEFVFPEGTFVVTVGTDSTIYEMTFVVKMVTLEDLQNMTSGDGGSQGADTRGKDKIDIKTGGATGIKTGEKAKLATAGKISLKLEVVPAGAGKVEGAGEYENEETVTIKAVPAEGFAFTKWSDGNTEAERKYLVKTKGKQKTITLKANFAKKDGGSQAEHQNDSIIQQP